MKKLIVTTLFAAVSLFADEFIRWNTPETLGKWKAQSNVKCELKDNRFWSFKGVGGAVC